MGVEIVIPTVQSHWVSVITFCYLCLCTLLLSTHLVMSFVLISEFRIESVLKEYGGEFL